MFEDDERMLGFMCYRYLEVVLKSKFLRQEDQAGQDVELGELFLESDPAWIKYLWSVERTANVSRS
jgi:hypothetical protein